MRPFTWWWCSIVGLCRPRLDAELLRRTSGRAVLARRGAATVLRFCAASAAAIDDAGPGDRGLAVGCGCGEPVTDREVAACCGEPRGLRSLMAVGSD